MDENKNIRLNQSSLPTVMKKIVEMAIYYSKIKFNE